jgi:hypothetical protein
MDEKTIKRFWYHVIKSGGCWNWIGYQNRQGYGDFYIRNITRHKKEHQLAHRFSWEIHNGPIPKGLYALHHCDNPSCVNPAHLFLGTKGDNNRDMAAKGRSRNGEKHGWAKITKSIVLSMRDKYKKGGTSYRKLAKEYGVSCYCAYAAITGINWKGV